MTIGSETSDINFNLKRSGGISGKVSDIATGSGVAGVIVTANSKQFGWYGQTDSNGNFKIITNLETGTYNLTVTSAAGYLAKTANNVVVTAGVLSDGVNLALTRSGIITGKVRTPSGSPVPNVSVSALSSDGADYVGFAQTGVDGSYRIDTGLGNGVYMVNVFTGMSFDQVQNIYVTAGNETPNVNLTLNITPQPTGGISGKITDVNSNPISGAEVTAGSGRAESDSQGNYLISSGLPTGTYTVYVSAAGYKDENKTNVQVTTGSTTSNTNFSLEAASGAGSSSGRISGKVMGEDNPLSNKQPSSITCITTQPSIVLGGAIAVSGMINPAVSGASVTLQYKVASTEVSRSVTTGGDGRYSDSYIPTTAGAWTVQASWGGNTQLTAAASIVATFTVTQPTVTIGGIKVTVLDNSNNPIVGATLSSTSTPSGQASLSGTTTSDGSISFNNLAVGSYVIQAAKNGYVTNTGTVNVVSGSTATLAIKLQTQPAGGGGTGGIPGYPLEGVVAGILIGVMMLYLLKRSYQ